MFDMRILLFVVGHVRRLPGDVCAVRLRVPVLLCVSHGCVLGCGEQRYRNTCRRLQAVSSISEAFSSPCEGYWSLAGEV